MCIEKMRALSYIGAEKITFPPKSDGRTDISIYRVTLLLKNGTRSRENNLTRMTNITANLIL